MTVSRTTPQHTPTPWTVQRLNHAEGETWLQIGYFDPKVPGREIGPLCEIAPVGNGVGEPPTWTPVAAFKYLIASDAEQLANADLIVRAVNSHAALVEALEEARDFIRKFKSEIPLASHLLPKLNAALAAAKGKP